MATQTWLIFKNVLGDVDPGESVIVPDPSATCASYAKKFGLRVRTEKVLVTEGITTDTPTVRTATKVTVLEPDRLVPERVR